MTRPLEEVLEISFNTTAVGILESLEIELGFLWGHGKSTEELSEDELHYREIWYKIRKDIFNKSESAKKISMNKAQKYTPKKTVTFKDFK